MDEIIKFIEGIEEQLITIRRDIHQYPEMGFEEYRTSQKIFDFLKKLDLEVKRIATTGVVALLDCGEGPVIALRADIDALPIEEKTKVSYKSKVTGVMHACGHDGHTAILLGVAKVLSKFRDRLKGKVKFIFQPAEEGPGGALPLIEAGVLEEPQVDNIFGLHVEESLPTGTIGVQPKVGSAAADEIDLLIKGKGGHAAAPHQGVDAIITASQVVTALQTVVSRQINPQKSAVISLGTINGGYKRNVIADEVEITGTVRTTDPDLRKMMPEMIEQIIRGITLSQRSDYNLDYRFGYPVLINSTELVHELKDAIGAIPYVDEIKYISQSSMGAEDFAYYLQQVPGIFFRLGAADPSEDYYPGHHPKFNFDERALKIGVALFVYITLNRIEE
ncbi:amidohydrolase [Orenia metallireducens]|uniref:Amidohydrolase n=1 Tax=Orenia metallireducens TaxID=1413210 RepID=A0A285H6U4_9FIRM|nr:amidohydrolase [Orenia metallireducens]PRX21114.1 amidohydrolase [Orenia metallireducens]SNY31477.1 amidohydrolase [Orenia metallireducens]